MSASRRSTSTRSVSPTFFGAGAGAEAGTGAGVTAGAVAGTSTGGAGTCTGGAGTIAAGSGGVSDGAAGSASISIRSTPSTSASVRSSAGSTSVPTHTRSVAMASAASICSAVGSVARMRVRAARRLSTSLAFMSDQGRFFTNTTVSRIDAACSPAGGMGSGSVSGTGAGTGAAGSGAETRTGAGGGAAPCRVAITAAVSVLRSTAPASPARRALW